jgi:adenylate kinase family enzyme
MERIAIIGCGGSGKTILARRLAHRLGLAVTTLDALYYDDGWNPTPMDKFAAIQRDLVAADRWIIEGNYASTLPIRLTRADTVIFLDLPARTCLWGIAQRRWRYRGGQHTDDVYDRITWSFIRYVLGYRRSVRPRVTALVVEHAQHARYLQLASRRQANQFLDQLDPLLRLCAPSCCTASLPDRTARATASGSAILLARSSTRLPRKASPAPVESMTGTRGAATVALYSWLLYAAPSAPAVTTIVVGPSARRCCAASKGSMVPEARRTSAASIWLTTKTSRCRRSLRSSSLGGTRLPTRSIR